MSSQERIRPGCCNSRAHIAGKVTSFGSIKVLAKKPCTKYNCDSQVFRLIGVKRSVAFVFCIFVPFTRTTLACWCLHLFAVKNSFYIVRFCNKLY